MERLFCFTGWRGWQNHSSMCRWPRISALHWHQRTSSSSSCWDSSFLWGLYPFLKINTFHFFFSSYFVFGHCLYTFPWLESCRQKEREQISQSQRLPSCWGCSQSYRVFHVSSNPESCVSISEFLAHSLHQLVYEIFCDVRDLYASYIVESLRQWFGYWCSSQ